MKKQKPIKQEEIAQQFFPHLTPSTRNTLVSILFDIYHKAGLITVKSKEHEKQN